MKLNEITRLNAFPILIIDDVRPACLPLKSAINKDITGVGMVAAGWGKINDSKLMPRTKLQIVNGMILNFSFFYQSNFE